jgi:hypothetical protein
MPQLLHLQNGQSVVQKIRAADGRLAALPEAGTYYLSLSDAHDQGGPAHVYRLIIK